MGGPQISRIFPGDPTGPWEEYARAHGATKVEIYSDPNKTGRNSRRKEPQRLVRDVHSGRIKVVVVHRLDHLYRNLESILGFVRFLKRHKVGLISVTENIDTKTRQGLQMLALLGMMAESYVHQTSERTREARHIGQEAACQTAICPWDIAMVFAPLATMLTGKEFVPCRGWRIEQKANGGVLQSLIP